MSITVGTAMALAAGASAAKGMWAGRKSKIEKAYGKSSLDELGRVSGGEGGMSRSKRQQAQAEGMGQIDSTIEEARAKSLRGANLGSGQAFAAQQELSKQRLGAESQMMSSVRQQDLEEAQRQREAAYMKAAMAEDMRNKRMDRAVKATEGSESYLAGMGQGASERKIAAATKLPG